MLRGGVQTLVSNHDIVAGDIMLLDTGDKVIADCIVVDYSQVRPMRRLLCIARVGGCNKLCSRAYLQQHPQLATTSRSLSASSLHPCSNWCWTRRPSLANPTP